MTEAYATMFKRYEFAIQGRSLQFNTGISSLILDS